MTLLLVIDIWRYRVTGFVALLTTLAIFLWPALPLRGIDSWLLVYVNTTYLLVLYPFIALLTGAFVGLVVYHRKFATSCDVGPSRTTGATGSLVGVLLGTCPACIPVVAIFLPLTFNIFLSRLAPVFSVIAIAILLFAIYRTKGFDRRSN